MSFIFWPDHPTPGASIGGKAGALLALHGRELSIPDWFVVLPDAAHEGSLAAAVTGELQAALDALCPAGELVAVRSSAMDEDGLRHSFAGQLESFLRVPPEEVAMKAAAVVASAYSERVRKYRERHGLEAPQPPAVLIQRMIHAEVSGVAFSADPLSGRHDIAVVTAVHGLGTALVNGEQNADTWRVDRARAIVHRQQSGLQAVLDDTQVRAVAELARRVEHILGPAQDIEWAMADGCLYLLQARPITGLERDRGEIGNRKSEIGTSVEAARCKVEATHEPWEKSEIGNRKLEIARCKVSTHVHQQVSADGPPHPGPLLPPREEREDCVGSRSVPGDELCIWDNSNIVESYSGVTTPLTFSFARRAYEGVYRQFCQILAVPRAKIAAHAATFREMLGLVRGRIYYNLLNWYRVLALLPGFTVNRRFMEQMMGVKEELPAEILSKLGRASLGARLKDSLNLSYSLAALLANHFLLPRKIRRFRARLDEALAPTDPPLATMPVDQLVAYFLALERKLLRRWDAPLLNDFFAMIFYGVLRRLTSQWAGDAAGTLQNDLLCGQGGMISAEPAVRLRRLAALARTDTNFVSLLCDGSTQAIVAAMETVPGFPCAYHEYLAKFGERCLEELKLESLTLHDDPLMLLRAVGRMAGGLEEVAPARGVDARQPTEKRIEQALAKHPWRRVVFRWVLRHARARVRDRENLRFERTRVFGRVRRIFIELGRRLHAEGCLREARDIFYLEVDEILGIRGETRACFAHCLRRQKEFEQYRSTAKPPDRFTTRRGSAEWSDAAGLASGVSPVNRDLPAEPAWQMAGIGCCPGVVRGRVRKIADPRSASLQPGEILVAERTDPGWILLFPAAAGLLLERGSVLSHSAIVARELRVPCIVAIEGLTRWLNDGDWVEMDGASGAVRRLAAAAPDAVRPPLMQPLASGPRQGRAPSTTVQPESLAASLS